MNLHEQPVPSKALPFLAIVSNYDLFHVLESTGYEFNASEICIDKHNVIKFRRIFAMSNYSDGRLTDIKALNDRKFVCNTTKSDYTIEALHTKTNEVFPSVERTWNELSDFMDISFFGKEYTNYIKELGLLILVVDPARLGKLRTVEHFQIKSLINIFLDGASINMQMCRTVCFQIDENNKIYAGLYDLEGRCPVTKKLIYTEKEIEFYNDELYNKAKDLIDYAIKVKQELFVEKS